MIIFNLTFDPTVCLGLGENIRFADTKEVNRTRKSDIKQYNGLQNDKKDNKQCSTLHRSFVVLLPCLPLFIYAIALSIIDWFMAPDYAFCIFKLKTKGKQWLNVKCMACYLLWNQNVVTRVWSRGGAPGAPPLKLEKIWFFGVKSWFFTRNTPKMFAPPSVWRNFFKCAPSNLKSWIRPWLLLVIW